MVGCVLHNMAWPFSVDSKLSWLSIVGWYLGKNKKGAPFNPNQKGPILDDYQTGTPLSQNVLIILPSCIDIVIMVTACSHPLSLFTPPWVTESTNKVMNTTSHRGGRQHGHQQWRSWWWGQLRPHAHSGDLMHDSNYDLASNNSHNLTHNPHQPPRVGGVAAVIPRGRRALRSRGDSAGSQRLSWSLRFFSLFFLFFLIFRLKFYF